MIKPILLHSNKSLKTPCVPVTDFNDPALQDLISNLLETMIANNGIGIAANQIGSNLTVCILNVEERTKKMFLINPTLIMYSKNKAKMSEGCLSAPGMSILMKRPESAIVDANTLTGEIVRYEFHGFDARILFHELDHTFGKTIVSGLQNYAPLL